MLFYRHTTDHARQPVALENQFAGSEASACWIIGGGKSLADLPCAEIDASPVPKMCLNLAGTRLVRPTFWTAYDPSARFHRSVYLDASVMKFVHPRRSMDLVPETTFKVGDCPNLYSFETDKQRGFADFLSPLHSAIVDWNDTFVQAINILYRLGFRELYLAGCEMQIRPADEWIAAASEKNVTYRDKMLLGEFARECEQHGLSRPDMERWGTAAQYHFEETKSLAAAINTDQHYFRIGQYLRLSRRSMSLAGLKLISVTPGSRLNDDFPYRDAHEVCRELTSRIGDPQAETTAGRYTHRVDRAPANLGPMRDYRPPHWKTESPARAEQKQPAERQSTFRNSSRDAGSSRHAELKNYLAAPIEVELDEEG